MGGCISNKLLPQNWYLKSQVHNVLHILVLLTFDVHFISLYRTKLCFKLLNIVLISYQSSLIMYNTWQQQRVSVEKALREQDGSIRQAQEQQQQAIQAALKQQQEAIKRAQLKQQQDIGNNGRKP